MFSDVWLPVLSLAIDTLCCLLDVQYAAACAAVQNMLLSLHAEGYGTKWATGPIIRTKAFRELIGCQETDRVVGLVMVGEPKAIPREPRRKKHLEDLVRDL